MSAKHTPGPWHLRTNRHPDTDGRPWGWLDSQPPGSFHQAVPKGVRVEWTRGDESEANARLIAAAPDLAFQLLAAANYIDALGGDSRSYRQAIAKATGDQA